MPLNVQCKRCANLKNGWCEKVIDSPDPDLNRNCQYFLTKKNFDSVHEMSADELASLLARGCHETRDCPTMPSPIFPFEETVESCEKCWLDWLEQEVQE